MNSKLTLRISCTVLVLAFSVVVAYPQWPPPTTPMPIPTSMPSFEGLTSKKVTVTAAATSKEQIRVASRLEWKIAEAQTPQQKFDAVAETLANLQIIPKAWPNDTSAIVEGAIMQAHVAGLYGLNRNAIDALTSVLPLVRKTPSEPVVETRLAFVYEMAGNFPEAEKHHLAAERSLSKDVNFAEASGVLGSLAMFYSRRDQPHEAIKRLRAQRDLPDQNVLGMISSQLQIVKEAVRLNDDTRHEMAKQELAALDQLLFRARATAMSPLAATSVEHAAQDAQRIKERHHL